MARGRNALILPMPPEVPDDAAGLGPRGEPRFVHVPYEGAECGG